MPFEVEFTDEFEAWWNQLSEDEQESVDFSVRLLQELGIRLTRPHADAINGSHLQNLRELRCQHHGRPYRVLYGFDPRRTAILSLGGNKTGNASWYKDAVPRAETLFARHLRALNE